MIEDVDYTAALYGEHARQVGAWLYVQDQGNGVVSFVGSSRTPDGSPHPLRYGSGLPHQLLVGEIIVRPHVAIETREKTGHGLGSIITDPHLRAESLDVLIGDPDKLRGIAWTPGERW